MTASLLPAIRDEAGYFAAVAEVRELVERIERVEDAKVLADRARAAQVWAERQRLGEQKVMLAIAARFWAARREGELLVALRANGERATGAGGRELRGVTLGELGIDKAESKRTQDLAAIPADRFAALIDDCASAGRLNFVELHRRAERAAREEAAAEAERALLADVAAHGGPAWSIEHADLREFEPGSVDAIVTDPPYVTEDAPELYRELGHFACRALKPGGALVAMVSHAILLDALDALGRPELVYRWAVCWLSGAHESTADQRYRVFDRWKPVLVYHLGPWPPDAPMLTDVVSSGRDEEKGAHPWQQTLAGTRQLVRAVARPGDVVCDPFLGAGTTAIAALAEHCHFVGCDVDQLAVARARQRLEVAA